MTELKPTEQDYADAAFKFWSDDHVRPADIRRLAACSPEFRAAVDSAFAAGVRAGRGGMHGLRRVRTPRGERVAYVPRGRDMPPEWTDLGPYGPELPDAS